MVIAEKAKLKSRVVYEGYHRAFARSYLRAMGLTDDDREALRRRRVRLERD